MAIENRLWGAERIRGELLKLSVSVAKSTVQRYLSRFRPSRSSAGTELAQAGRARRDNELRELVYPAELPGRAGG